MINKLEEYADDKGLIQTSLITIDDHGNFWIDGIKIQEVRELKKLVNFLQSDEELWKISRIKVEEKIISSRSGAPIINIPFSIALHKIITNQERSIKSLFSFYEKSPNGICGSLFAKSYKSFNHAIKQFELNFQLWEFYHLDSIPTHYIHGIYNLSTNYFTHFDGALITHDEKNLIEMQSGNEPNKNSPYEKLFVLNGIISTENAMTMMSSYLPIDELNIEFGICEKDLNFIEP